MNIPHISLSKILSLPQPFKEGLSMIAPRAGKHKPSLNTDFLTHIWSYFTLNLLNVDCSLQAFLVSGTSSIAQSLTCVAKLILCKATDDTNLATCP